LGSIDAPKTMRWTIAQCDVEQQAGDERRYLSREFFGFYVTVHENDDAKLIWGPLYLYLIIK
jgi:hypothetical protein